MFLVLSINVDIQNKVPIVNVVDNTVWFTDIVSMCIDSIIDNITEYILICLLYSNFINVLHYFLF
jgi:hypothetical protein